LGLRLYPVGAETVGRTHPQLRGGMAVAEVKADSPAEKAGVKAGDILVGLHLWEMLSADNVTFVLHHPDLPTFGPLRFYVLRAGTVHRGTFLLPD
jgi:serine protease Do